MEAEDYRDPPPTEEAAAAESPMEEEVPPYETAIDELAAAMEPEPTAEEQYAAEQQEEEPAAFQQQQEEPATIEEEPAATEEQKVIREIQILETAEDIQMRRDQVLGRYNHFREATRVRRQRLEDARRFMYFKRDADELESWINEKLQTASDESYRDPTNLQVYPQVLQNIVY